MKPDFENHDQKIAYGRAGLWAPFYAVGMAVRIQGDVPIDKLKMALRKLQTLYPPLGSRVRVEEDGTAWLTTHGVGEFPLEIRNMTSGDDWAMTFLEQERLPFAFDRGPLTRFFLLRGNEYSDLVAIVPHVICDGYSMTYVMTDVVALLNDPDLAAVRPGTPPAVCWQNIRHSPLDGLLLRGLVRVLNRTWAGGRLVLQQDKYEELHRHYWANQNNGILVFDLLPAETSQLAARCKQRNISVTGALTAAFLMAQAEILPDRPTARREISIPVNIRDRLVESPGRVVGVYASSVELVMPNKPGISFWELASEGHIRLHKALHDRSKILRILVLDELDPSIADALIAAICTDNWGVEFGLLSRLIKLRGEIRSLDVSNIGRVVLPETGTSYRIQTILPFPPLIPGSKMTLNVLTVDGRMNIILKYRQNEVNGAAAQIKDRALNYLFNA